MARQYVYQIVPTEQLSSLLHEGLRPRITIISGIEYSERVWLYTDLNMAYYMASIWFMSVLSDAEKRLKRNLIPDFLHGTDIGWRWNGKEWCAVSSATFSIIQIDRKRVRCISDGLRYDIPRQLRRTVVWTADHILPPFKVLKLNIDVFMSPRFQQFIGHDPAIKAAQKERPAVRDGRIRWLKGKPRSAKR